MKEYCAQSVAQFKEIVTVINLPMKTFDFKMFSSVITKVLSLSLSDAFRLFIYPVGVRVDGAHRQNDNDAT